VSRIECNYQRVVTPEEFASALAEGRCEHCSISARELVAQGQILEVCGEEFCGDLVTGTAVVVPVPLCPECHRKNHLDGRSQHNPCQIKARRSREML
jgi:hypothetical protein